ncbi:MAG: hypothetical protein L0J54_05160 [Halomonas sp.]|nr:hypothetical protein [Halomonas sp.]MDN6297401.1 hypothetical protein [Halomonas sp.]MDN6314678.1 hypothetical protein [Halomonas sp.]MDN6336293.1 hypothetical protein [Halomonas sp.]
MDTSWVESFNKPRLCAALVCWFGLAVAVMLPLVWLINNRDWGIALMLVMPGVVYGLMRLGRRLQGWARASA